MGEHSIPSSAPSWQDWEETNLVSCVEEEAVVARGPDNRLVVEVVEGNPPVEEQEGNGIEVAVEESEEDDAVDLEHLCCSVSKENGTVICCMIAASNDRADFHGFDCDLDCDFGCS